MIRSFLCFDLRGEVIKRPCDNVWGEDYEFCPNCGAKVVRDA